MIELIQLLNLLSKINQSVCHCHTLLHSYTTCSTPISLPRNFPSSQLNSYINLIKPHFKQNHLHSRKYNSVFFTIKHTKLCFSIFIRKDLSKEMIRQKQNRNQSLLSRLRRAVNKVRLLLTSTIISRTWHIASAIRSASLSRRQLSFSDGPGLRLCSDETGSADSGSSHGGGLQRTISCPSDDDIDKRAEMFISNFRRQLQMERQISLQLRYRRENSFESISPWFDLAVMNFCWVWTLFANGVLCFLGEALHGDLWTSRFSLKVFDWSQKRSMKSKQKQISSPELWFFYFLFFWGGGIEGKFLV